MRKYGLTIVLAIALVFATGWGVYQYKEKNLYNTYLDGHFQRQFYELLGHVENAQVNLSKAMVSASNRDIAKFLNDTASQSYMAQEKLSQLPFHHGGIRGTEKFLSQLGDYCTAMMSKSLEGISLNEKELHTMAEFHDYASHFSQQLMDLHGRVVAGGVHFGDLGREGNRKLSKIEDQMKDFNIVNFEERMQEYPELIYDGPFSDHLKNIKPKLKGNEISSEDAVKVIAGAFDNHKNSTIKVADNIKYQPIDGYYITIFDENTPTGQEATAAVSKIGGKIIWYMNPVFGQENNISSEEAIRKAEDFLKRTGYHNMKMTYSMAYENQIVINFAYEEDDVLVYTDLIKVKVALDDGHIIGLESQGYLTNNHQRNIKKPELTEEEARQKLSSGVKEENARLAIIPTEGGNEVLTYEFEVKFGEDNYLIYIDANTGIQRKMLLMVNEKGGTLVI